MPLNNVTVDGEPCWQWGDTGKPYPYDPDDPESEKVAKQKAIDQGLVMGDGELKKCSLEKIMPIAKVDDDEHKVFCVVAVPDEFDLQGDRSSRKEIEKAAHKFMERLQKFGTPGVGAHHKNAISASIIENVVTQQDGIMLGDQVLKAGTWYQGHKVDDPDIWKGIKSGEITGLSRQGRGIRRAIGGITKTDIEKYETPSSGYFELIDEELDRIDWVGKAANGRKIAIIKMVDELTESDNMVDNEPAGAKSVEPVQAHVEKADIDSIVEKALLEERKNRDIEIKKAVDAAIEKEQIEKAEIKKKLDEERDVRITKEFIEKAATMPSLGSASDVGPILKEISQKAPEAFGKLDPILKALDERVKQGELFAEIGKSNTGPLAGSAEEKLTGIAKSYVEKGLKGGYPEAFTKACQDNEDLYNQYVAEQRRGR